MSGSLDDTVKAWLWSVAPLMPHAFPDDLRLRVPRNEDEGLELRYIFEGHSLGVVSVDISCDGRTAATSSLDCHIRFWDLESGSAAPGVSNIDAGPIDSWTIAFSPDSSLIATGNHAGKINLFSTETGKSHERLETMGKFAMSVAFSPDGKWIACGVVDGMIKVFDVESGKMVHALEGHAMPVRTLAFSPDSGNLMTGSDDSHIKIYDMRNAEPIATLSGHGSWVLCVDASPTSTQLASRWVFIDGLLLSTRNSYSSFMILLTRSSSDKTVKLWDLHKRECIHTFTNHTEQVWSCKYNHDGTRLVSAGDDGHIFVYGCA